MDYIWMFIAIIVGIKILIAILRRNEAPKLKIARKKHKTDFGTYPDDSAKFKDTKIETPIGTFICYHDGTFSDRKNKLMWIQAPWGMEWNGKKFKGECIKLNWNVATQLFGDGGGQAYHGIASVLTKEDIEANYSENYEKGSCVVTFSGYSDWRLPTAKELLTLAFCEELKPDNRRNSKSGYYDHRDTKSNELREQLFPDFPDINAWSANHCGNIAWLYHDGILDDLQRNDKYPILFVRNW